MGLFATQLLTELLRKRTILELSRYVGSNT